MKNLSNGKPTHLYQKFKKLAFKWFWKISLFELSYMSCCWVLVLFQRNDNLSFGLLTSFEPPTRKRRFVSHRDKLHINSYLGWSPEFCWSLINDKQMFQSYVSLKIRKNLQILNYFIPKKAKFPAPKRRTTRPKKVKKAKSIVEVEKSELLTVSNNTETTKVKKVRKSKKDRDSKKAKKTKSSKKEKKQIIEDESKYFSKKNRRQISSWKFPRIFESSTFAPGYYFSLLIKNLFFVEHFIFMVQYDQCFLNFNIASFNLNINLCLKLNLLWEYFCVS